MGPNALWPTQPKFWVGPRCSAPHGSCYQISGLPWPLGSRDVIDHVIGGATPKFLGGQICGLYDRRSTSDLWNSMGPKTEPWGTPSSSCHSADRRPLYSTRCERPHRNDAIQSWALPQMPHVTCEQIDIDWDICQLVGPTQPGQPLWVRSICNNCADASWLSIEASEC